MMKGIAVSTFLVICVAGIFGFGMLNAPAKSGSDGNGAGPSDNPKGANLKVGIHPGGIGVSDSLRPAPGHQLAAFSEGCFWGSEEVFRKVKGVVATAVGYTGGHTVNPTYEDVCTHTTGHAETTLVEFDPKIVTYKTLLFYFWNSHDPTTLNRQGPDVGDSYRSAIWTFTPEQLAEAKASETAEQKKFSDPIVTEIKPVGPFYMAELYHQQYEEKTGYEGCPVFFRAPAKSSK